MLTNNANQQINTCNKKNWVTRGLFVTILVSTLSTAYGGCSTWVGWCTETPTELRNRGGWVRQEECQSPWISSTQERYYMWSDGTHFCRTKTE